MAGRQLQRLLKEQLPPADEIEVSSSEEEEEEAPSRPAFNPFDLLTDGDSAEEGEEASDEDADEGDSDDETPAAPAPPPAEARKPAGGAKAAAAAKGKAKEEDIDAILAELNITPAGPSSSAAAAAPSDSRPLLAVSASHLRAEEELRRMFGSMGVRGRDDDDEPGAAYAGASRRVRRLAARGLLRPVGGALRPGVLVTPRDAWPRPDGGVTLRPLGAGAFEVAYSPAYEAVQALYEECQATFDPNAVAALLRAHPYHLDALLTMADLYRATADNAYADEMVERAVYALESGWPPGFLAAAAAGEARVAYCEASAPLFTALARHVGALGRRGLHRTALEVAKLLLQLDADDPMGALQQLDYFAVRAGQYDYLRRFVEGAGGGGGDAGSAALLPNMTYSLALARWYQEQEKGKKRRGEAAAPGEEAEPSEDLLVKAILLHPLVVVRLQGKLGEAGVGRDARWAQALAAPLFAGAGDGGCPGLGHLVDIFVERQAALWKAGPVQEWLYGGVRRACAANEADLPGGLGAGDWAAVRAQAFPPAEGNAYAHLRVYDFSDSVPRLPAEEVHGMAGAAQAQALGAADVEAALAAELAALEAAGGGGAEALRGQNPLMALLRSLLPWVAEGQQPEYGADEGEQGERREGGGAE